MGDILIRHLVEVSSEPVPEEGIDDPVPDFEAGDPLPYSHNFPGRIRQRHPAYLEQGQMETVLDSHSVEVPGLSLYYPSRSQSLPKLRAFIELATTKMRRDFQSTDYLATPTS
jgi:hypothetical protein